MQQHGWRRRSEPAFQGLNSQQVGVTCCIRALFVIKRLRLSRLERLEFGKAANVVASHSSFLSHYIMYCPSCQCCQVNASLMRGRGRGLTRGSGHSRPETQYRWKIASRGLTIQRDGALGCSAPKQKKHGASGSFSPLCLPLSLPRSRVASRSIMPRASRRLAASPTASVMAPAAPRTCPFCWPTPFL